MMDVSVSNHKQAWHNLKINIENKYRTLVVQDDCIKSTASDLFHIGNLTVSLCALSCYDVLKGNPSDIMHGSPFNGMKHNDALVRILNLTNSELDGSSDLSVFLRSTMNNEK